MESQPGSTENTQQLMENLDQKVALLYEYQCIMASYSAIQRDYGCGEKLSEVEAHTLGFIYDKEGVSAKQLAADTIRTKGAVSQILAKLEQKGMIYRESVPDNKRMNYIYTTDRGKLACRVHRSYDRDRMMVMMNQLLIKCSADEIDGFFKVLGCRVEIIRREIQ
jgi:DNA-binding MarR family transcriptional regulator